MSRSHRGSKKVPELGLWAANKRLRHGVHQVLLESTRLTPGAWYEVLADHLEERGLASQADRLRHDPDPLLPRAPAGWNSRLRS